MVPPPKKKIKTLWEIWGSHQMFMFTTAENSKLLQTPLLCILPHPGPPGNGSGRPVNQMHRRPVHVPPYSPTQQGDPETSAGALHGDPDCPRLASESMVPARARDAVDWPIQLPNWPKPPQPPDIQTPRLEGVEQAKIAEGFSGDILEMRQWQDP